jgi:hypothetical protein
MERFQPLPSDPQATIKESGLDRALDAEKVDELVASGQQGENEKGPNTPTGAAVVHENQLLLRNDHAARNALMISFLYEAYEPQYWYWEVVETTRRLMLTAVLSVCGAGTSAQALLAILLALMYIKLYGFYSPYTKVTDDIVAETGQFQIFLSFLGALVYQRQLLGDEWNTLISVALILINTAVFFLFVFFAATTLYREVKTADISLLSIREDDQTTVKLLSAAGSAVRPTAGASGSRNDLRKVYVEEDSDQIERLQPSSAGDSAPASRGDESRELYKAEDNDVVEIQPEENVYLDAGED